MAVPDDQTLMLPVLEAAARGETRVAEVANSIATQFALSNADREELLPSGRQPVLHNRIHWAKFYLSKAGFITSPARGRFMATEAGKALLATSPASINNQTLLREPSFREFHRGDATPEEAADPDPSASPVAPALSAAVETALTPEDQIEAAWAIHRAGLRADLLERIVSDSPARLEKLIVDLLVAMGYGGSHRDARRQLGGTGDGGVDGVISEDRLGLDRIYVQAKRYALGNTVGRPDVQSFVGSLVGLGATKGVFVTTATFSQQARAYVANLTHRVILIDGETLAELMIEHGVGVRTSRTITLHDIDNDFFSDPE